MTSRTLSGGIACNISFCHKHISVILIEENTPMNLTAGCHMLILILSSGKEGCWREAISASQRTCPGFNFFKFCLSCLWHFPGEFEILSELSFRRVREPENYHQMWKTSQSKQNIVEATSTKKLNKKYCNAISRRVREARSELRKFIRESKKVKCCAMCILQRKVCLSKRINDLTCKCYTIIPTGIVNLVWLRCASKDSTI